MACVGLLLSLPVIQLQAALQETATQQVRSEASVFATEDAIEKRMQELQVPGASVAVIKGGKLVLAQGYGIANTQNNAQVDEQTLFQAGSISKPLAALAALKLVEQGKLSLDKDVNNYLKDWKLTGEERYRKTPVTLRHLLTHTAGLTVHGFPGYARGTKLPSTTEVLQGKGNTGKVQIDKRPGDRWRYSGGGYTVMQKLVEDVTGLPFAEYADANILKPMGMTHSTYQHNLPETLKSHASAAFDRNGKMFDVVYNDYPEKAAAGLWTTPTDILKYVLHMQAILQGKTDGILQKTTVESMFSKHKNGWGLGPHITESSGQLVFGHGGKNLGFTNDFRAFAHKGDGFIIMTNADSGRSLITELAGRISAHYSLGSSVR